MGMDLNGAGGYSQWNGKAWCDLLDLGGQYGWKPIGTGPPRGTLKSKWKGDTPFAAYYSNDGALFYARDARNLADALIKAFDEIPTKPLAGGKKAKTLVESFASWGRPAIKDFVAFCRKGSFRIF